MTPSEAIAREPLLADRSVATLPDALADPDSPFHEVVAFFDEAERVLGAEDGEARHDRAPRDGDARELEPEVGQRVAPQDLRRGSRLRRAIGAVVRLVVKDRGRAATAEPRSLAVRGAAEPRDRCAESAGAEAAVEDAPLEGSAPPRPRGRDPGTPRSPST